MIAGVARLYLGRKTRSAPYHQKEDEMAKVHARLWGSLLLAVLIALGAITPTFAAPPTTSTFQLQGTQLLANCNGFQVFDDYDATIVQTNYYNQDGNRVEIHQAISGTDTYRQSVTGQSITMGTHFMVHVDTQTMLNSSAGMQYHLMIPGLGHVLLDVGRTVYDLNAGTYVFLAGTHQVATGDTAGLCAAFP
jgi:hypothetical protein